MLQAKSNSETNKLALFKEKRAIPTHTQNLSTNLNPQHLVHLKELLPIPSLNTLASFVFELCYRQIDRQTDKQTNKQTEPNILSTMTNSVDVGNYKNSSV